MGVWCLSNQAENLRIKVSEDFNNLFPVLEYKKRKDATEGQEEQVKYRSSHLQNEQGKSSHNMNWFKKGQRYGLEKLYDRISENVQNIPQSHRGCPRGVMIKAMDCGIVVSDLVLQLRYYVHFRTNTLGKGMNPLFLPAMD